MKCDDFPSAREIGGAFRRFLAARHEATCPKCRAFAQTLDAAKRQFATPQPLSARARLLWKQAATEQLASMPFFTRGLALYGGLFVAVAFLCIALVSQLKHPSQTGSIAPVSTLPAPVTSNTVVHPIEAQAIDSSPEFNRMSAGMNELDARIAALREKASCEQARQEVAGALMRFEHW